MRTLWTGSIGFGLVNIPVRLYSGSSEQGIDFDMLHQKDQSPIRYARVCKEEGEEVPYDEIVKGYQYEEGKYVILTDEDFEKANVAKTKQIEVVSFALETEVDANYYDKPYWLEPQKGGERAYALLREALKESGKVGVARFVLRNREHMALVRSQDDALVLNQLRFADELRSPTELKLPTTQKVDAKELKMALSLIEQITEPFDPQQYKDTYTEELQRLIESKVQGKTPKAKGKAPEPSKVKDLMSLLKASLEGKPGRKSAAGQSGAKTGGRRKVEPVPEKKARSARRKAS
jgi:DNA end-binding protein Ku